MTEPHPSSKPVFDINSAPTATRNAATGSWGARALVASTLLVLALTACGRSSDPTDTNTQWLMSCDGDDDCAGEFSCFCGVCTVRCSATAACSELSEDAVCAPSTARCDTRVCALPEESATDPESTDPEPTDSASADVTSTNPAAPSQPDDGSPSTTPSGTVTDSALETDTTSVPDAGSPASPSSSSSPEPSAVNTSLDGGNPMSTDAPQSTTDASTTSETTPDAGSQTPTGPLICDLWGSTQEPVLEACQAEQACCTCGCAADTDACLDEASCPPRAGVSCGTAQCAGTQICCSASRNLCAADQAGCDAALADFSLPDAGGGEPSVEMSAALVDGIGCCDTYGVVWRDIAADYCVYAEFQAPVGSDGVLTRAIAAQPASACVLSLRTGGDQAVEAESAHGFIIITYQEGGPPLLDTWFTASFDGSPPGLPRSVRVAREALTSDGSPN